MRNVLIISKSFPPLNNIASRRFGYMVGYMEEFGWKPWIITQPSSGDLEVALPEQQIARISARPRSFRSRYSRHFYWTGIQYRVDALTSSWYWSVVSQRHLIDEFPIPDIILASYGPNSALWLGRYFSKQYRVPWIADFRDPGAIRNSSRSRIGATIDRFSERAVLKSAAAITTAGNTWSEMMASYYNRPAQTVYNGFEYDGIEDLLTESCESSPEVAREYIYYAGTVYDHQLRAIKLLLEALEDVPNVRLRMRMIGNKGPSEIVARWVAESTIAHRVDLLQRCPAAIAMQEAQHALANLVVEDLGADEVWRRGTLTGKLLPLLPLEPPILVIVRPDSDIGPILERTNKGLMCSDVSSVVSFFKSITGPSQFSGNRAEISRYSKRNQCGTICTFFDQFAR